MRIGIMSAAILALVSTASAEDYGHPTAFVVSPIHEAQIVRGDDGMDHVEYDLLIVSVLPEPVTLSSVTVLGPAGKELMRIEHPALAAVTQPLFAHTKTTEIPASAAVAVEVDLILPPDTAPERLTHRIAYALKAGSVLAPMFDNLEVDAPDVTIARQPALVLKPPVKGDGWLVSSGCCKPNLHRDLRVAIDGLRIETSRSLRYRLGQGQERQNLRWRRQQERTALRLRAGRARGRRRNRGFDPGRQAGDNPEPVNGPGNKGRLWRQSCDPQNSPECLRLYVHLHTGSVAVKVGDMVKTGALLAKIGNTGPSLGPHLHFGLSDKPDFFSGRALPFVFDSFTMVGAVDFDASEADHVVMTPDSRQVRFAYPLYGSITNFP